MNDVQRATAATIPLIGIATYVTFAVLAPGISSLGDLSPVILLWFGVYLFGVQLFEAADTSSTDGGGGSS